MNCRISARKWYPGSYILSKMPLNREILATSLTKFNANRKTRLKKAEMELGGEGEKE
jgi:hypothetical protein